MTLVGFSNNLFFLSLFICILKSLNINTNVGEEKTVMVEINFLELKISSFFFNYFRIVMRSANWTAVIFGLVYVMVT